MTASYVVGHYTLCSDLRHEDRLLLLIHGVCLLAAANLQLIERQIRLALNILSSLLRLLIC